MVFSQSSHKTQSILKVVEINRSKSGKNQQANCLTGVVTDGRAKSTLPSYMATTSCAEVSGFCRAESIKPEPGFRSEMYHDSDCEFFQDLVQWCTTPAEQEVVQSIDNPKITETRTLNTDTLHSQISPQGWDVCDAISPSAQAFLYNQPSYPVSPAAESVNFNMDYLDTEHTANSEKMPFHEQFLDINSLPVVISDLASESNTDTNLWQATEPAWQNTYDMEYNKTFTNTLPFIDTEDSLDLKLISVQPREVEHNDVVISEYVINGIIESGGIPKEEETYSGLRNGGLSVDVISRSQPWAGDVISTPEVLSFVEQLEREKCPLPTSITPPAQDDVCIEATTMETSCHVDYDLPITPKSEPQIDSEDDVKLKKRKRRHHDSEDSDETYTPVIEHTTRKYRKRKPTLPIKEMIRELEGSQQLPKARRGRPPKRRESTVSTISENSSVVSSHEFKYRELRDKNNEASKRSRMTRKLKELQMEQLAEELEEKNKKLRVRAELLEEMTKKLRDSFLTAVAQKKE